MTISELIEVIEQRIEARKSTLKWIIATDKSQLDKEAVEHQIDTYQDVLNIINE